jgi:Curlin associated repeat
MNTLIKQKLLVASICLFTPFAYADIDGNNLRSPDQVYPSNIDLSERHNTYEKNGESNIFQIGNYNEAIVNMSGKHNEVDISQIGNRNKGDISVTGKNDTVSVTQNGNGLSFDLKVDGNNRNYEITQTTRR